MPFKPISKAYLAEALDYEINKLSIREYMQDVEIQKQPESF